ncbi:unnamed protein product [Paramecium sonneborni]|uniref:Uncharacterized protein n=1 Tax=Paramecium sonneborni TaxID=65129 RepID=A0A8S1NMY2_9CILI|nr:unnamed protein product [Paramecium sonneborni]
MIPQSDYGMFKQDNQFNHLIKNTKIQWPNSSVIFFNIIQFYSKLIQIFQFLQYVNNLIYQQMVLQFYKDNLSLHQEKIQEYYLNKEEAVFQKATNQFNK